ncbi:nitrate reductase molybdenum cofactor assembly chaperone [Streptosporangium sp. H16]|uniref:nitrate reductase molybdenum cofactor assembly chaperone n=1 Tax=Streptosporangium sp. H16 TaxID=3444184 RepID=UPI003F7A8C18
MKRTRRAGTRGAQTDRQHAIAWQAASLLLDYPDDKLFGQLPLLRSGVAQLPEDLCVPLNDFLDHAESTTSIRLAAHYVEMFDTRRRCCLYLSYYAHGDTRKRGMALLRFKQAYRAAGLELSDHELPDHLAVLLEFGATGNLAEGRRLLLEHRAGLELLRLALTDATSPYADVVVAVCRTLPPLQGKDRDAVARLAAAGPPNEEVGLQPFAPPEYMPNTMGARR